MPDFASEEASHELIKDAKFVTAETFLCDDFLCKQSGLYPPVFSELHDGVFNKPFVKIKEVKSLRAEDFGLGLPYQINNRTRVFVVLY